MKMITATFLIVEEGKDYTVQAESSEEMMDLIRSNLNGKTVMTELNEEAV